MYLEVNVLPQRNYSNVFTVLAGPERAPFLAHKDRLCHDSDFFVKACSRAWQKDEKKEVPVEGVEPSIMSLYIHWKYEHKIDLDLVPFETPDGTSGWADLDEQKLEHEISQLIRLYVAGDMLLDKGVMNEVIDELSILSDRARDDSWMFVNCEHVDFVWEYTGIDSKLRTFIIDSCAARACLDMSDKEVYPSDFFVQLACRQMELRARMTAQYYPTVVGRCLYHEHEGSTANAHGLHLQCAKRERHLQMRVHAKRSASTNVVVDSGPVKKRKRDSEQ
ncbi:hypothetical protein LTR27_008664 [Elasticomyces elasticus]|nr:hypothetical protein LTR27_008664 [Elasticomyces elasticus]